MTRICVLMALLVPIAARALRAEESQADRGREPVRVDFLIA
jgi:hypothetical protein